MLSKERGLNIQNQKKVTLVFEGRMGLFEVTVDLKVEKTSVIKKLLGSDKFFALIV
jgi:hypothetical protein